MNNRRIAGGLAILACVASTEAPAAAEKFRKLTGAEIRGTLVGMEMTDEVHWGDVYDRNGTLTTYSMGRKTVGKWRIQKDEICHDRGEEFSGCYQVWVSGKKVELRREGSKLPLEGVLQRPSQRK